MSTGMPCSGPRGPLALRSLSRSDAIDNASGFNSITELIAGPCLSTSSIRSRYFLVSECALYFPEAIPLCNSAMVNSSSSNAGGGALGVDEVCAAFLAVVVMLTLASPTLPATLWRTNVLRVMFSRDDGLLDRRHVYSESLVELKWLS